MQDFLPKSEVSKADLERAKLEREIRELNRPFLRRPAMLAVIGPTILAAATLGLGLWTGLFDLERTRLENDKTLLELQKFEVQKELEAERAELNVAQTDLKRTQQQLRDEEALLKRRAAEIETQLTRKEEQLARELKKQQDTYDAKLALREQAYSDQLLKARSDQDRQLAQLKSVFDQELKSLQQSIADGEAQLAEVQRELLEPQTFALMTAMRSNRSEIRDGTPTERLIEKAKSDQNARRLIEEVSAEEPDAQFKLAFLYILQKADPSKARMIAILDHFDDNSQNVDVWDLAAIGYWSKNEEIAVLIKMGEIAKREQIPKAALRQSLSFFSLPDLGPNELRAILRQKKMWPFVSQLWQTMLDDPFFSLTAVHATNMTTNVSQEAGIYFALLMQDHPRMSDRSQFVLSLNEAVSQTYFPGMVLSDTDKAAFRDVLALENPGSHLDSAKALAFIKALEAGDVSSVLELSAK